MWREYDRKTAHLLDANHRQIGAQKDPPTVDLGRIRSEGWRQDQVSGRIKTGPTTLFYSLYNPAGGETLGKWVLGYIQTG